MKKKTRREKALEFQGWCARWLRQQDWIVHNLCIGGRWQRNRDVFGADIIAKKKGRGLTLWVQATADPSASIARKLRPIAAVPWNWLHDRPMLWIRRSSRPSIIEVRVFAAKGLMRLGQIYNLRWEPDEGVSFEF